RFYKGAQNTGIHVGSLWSDSGELLAQATFTNESASGWQQVDFGVPVALQADTLYVASYHTEVGGYSVDTGYFASAYSNGPLTAPADGADGGNGVYRYGPGGFPSNTWNAANYWVDVVFTTNTGPDTTAPAVTGTLPSDGAVDVGLSATLTATFSEPMAALTIDATTLTLTDSGSTLVDATVDYDGSTRTATLTPNAPLAVNTPYTATVAGGAAGVTDAAGNPLPSDLSWTFTTVVTDPCATPANAIVAENCLSGNPPSEWDVNGAGDLSIQGFATDISVDLGDTVEFKIDTDASDYRLDIYRMGYYDGDGARLIDTVLPSATLPQSQPACLQEASTGLIDCGNWGVSASWVVPSNATSGIYFAKVIREDTLGASHIVFVVRDDIGGSDILFQTADTTWQAYNTYGGSSLYSGGPGAQGGAYKVSYNRPFNTRSVDGGQDWVFSAEYPMVRWLEANGYDVSYFTGVDSDRFGAAILEHEVFLSVGHDEYWSGQQRANVEAARDAGMHLAFFSGNEVFWKTRWEASIDGSATTYRTLVCYKETHANAKIDPDPAWTGTWRDPRFSPPADGDRPENALTGTIFTVNAGATTNIQVPAADGKMRFWRNTSIADLLPGETAVLPRGTLGYEWDEDLDNGFRPAGLIRMSTTTVAGAPVLVDYGSTFGSGTATHNLTLHRHDSGALVFGAGTVQWSWGLDDNYDDVAGRGGDPADARMQQAMVNLLADMQTQPATLQSGLVPATASTDALAPGSTISSPVTGTDLVVGTPVLISGTAADVGGGVVGAVEVSLDGGVTWHPADGRADWSYSWTPAASGAANIFSRAVDDSGNLETPNSGIVVTIGSGGDTTPPTIGTTLPPDGAPAVSVGTSVTATFSEAMNPATITTATFELSDGVNAVPAAVTYDGAANTAILTPVDALSADTTYTATVIGGTDGVEDVAGNGLASNFVWSFTTAPE
ncbi:MAG: N,N-dimethylformamidase beta subunit family domain-containing protein, partial [Thiohalocapsa sp.]